MPEVIALMRYAMCQSWIGGDVIELAIAGGVNEGIFGDVILFLCYGYRKDRERKRTITIRFLMMQQSMPPWPGPLGWPVGIQGNPAMPVFRRLAHDTSRGLDGDSGVPASPHGSINFEEFANGFEGVSDLIDLGRMESDNDGHNFRQAWESFQQRLGEEAKFIPRNEQVATLYQNINLTEPRLVLHYERVVMNFIREIKLQNSEMENLALAVKRAQDKAAMQLSEMEEEMDQRIQASENKIRQEETRKAEAALGDIKHQYDSEVCELQVKMKKLKMYLDAILVTAFSITVTKAVSTSTVPRSPTCSVPDPVPYRYQIRTEVIAPIEEQYKHINLKDEVVGLKRKISELTLEKQQLKRELLESQTNIAFLQSELDSLKCEYTDQSIILEQDKAMIKDYTDERDNLTRQIEILHVCFRFRSIAKSYFRRADGVLLLYDVTYEKSLLNIQEWVDMIEDVSQGEIPIMLVGNKADLREQAIEEGIKCIPTSYGERLAMTTVTSQLKAFCQVIASAHSRGIQAFLLYPVTLKVNHNSSVQLFQSPDEARAFLDSPGIPGPSQNWSLSADVPDKMYSNEMRRKERDISVSADLCAVIRLSRFRFGDVALLFGGLFYALMYFVVFLFFFGLAALDSNLS
ncbi:UNVERIFIED_CONTAM: hypothetical protein FKN15_066094 [Acipenser sinensis]